MNNNIDNDLPELESLPVDTPQPSKSKEQTESWYVVYTMGYEDKVKQQILKRAMTMDAEDAICEIYVPKKAVTKVKDGKRIEKNITHYQRYIFVKMLLNDLTYRVVRHTPGVLNIIEKPLSQVEVAKLFGRKKKVLTPIQTTTGSDNTETRTTVEYHIDFNIGDRVRIEGGAFDGFEGEAESINSESGKVTVIINVLGRHTPVDLTADQVHAL